MMFIYYEYTVDISWNKEFAFSDNTLLTHCEALGLS